MPHAKFAKDAKETRFSGHESSSLNSNSEVEMGSARAARGVFRALAENAERTEKFEAFGRMSCAKRLDARRVQRHPRRVCSPTSVFELNSERKPGSSAALNKLLTNGSGAGVRLSLLALARGDVSRGAATFQSPNQADVSSGPRLRGRFAGETPAKTAETAAPRCRSSV